MPMLIPYRVKLECFSLPFTYALVKYLQASLQPSRVEPQRWASSLAWKYYDSRELTDSDIL
jgi:hypothetical protein